MNESEPIRVAIEDRLSPGSGFAGSDTLGLIESALARAGFQIVNRDADALITVGGAENLQQRPPGDSADQIPQFLFDPVLSAEADSAANPMASSLRGVACCFSPKADSYGPAIAAHATSAYVSPFIDPEAYLSAQRDTAALRQTLSRKHRLPADGKWVFLSVTPETSESSLNSTIESLSRLSAPNWSLVVSATHEMRSLVERLMPRLTGNDRHLLQGDDPAERRSFLAASDLFLIADRSGGNVFDVLEALASGLAVVASKSPVIEDVVENGRSGRLSPPGNPASLLNNLTFLLRHDNFLQSHRDQSRSQMLARHDILIAAQAFRNLIASAFP